jgi:hypothetical protein
MEKRGLSTGLGSQLWWDARPYGFSAPPSSRKGMAGGGRSKGEDRLSFYCEHTTGASISACSLPPTVILTE